ncbi:protein takeout-like [Aricia agestis]|uniref:protein takeout-like n=1 Tax=Aricia agestis TaxID=91739 RepID=UPI001C2032E2|nr:protein takeout-like [Aricia agestis]
MAKYILLCVVLCVGHSFAKVAPDYIKPCPKSDSECLKKTIQEVLPLFTQGIPSIGVNSLDPMEQKSVNIELPGGLKIVFKDGVVKGFKTCKVDSAKYNDLNVDINMHCDLTIKGKYTAQGNILIVSINGDGDAKIKLPNLGLKIKYVLEDKTQNGVVYRTLKDHKVTTSYDGRVSFTFTNLFKGNPELSQAVLTFLNENWKQLVEEFGKPIEDVIIKGTIRNIKKFFESVPRDELFVA